MFAIPASFENLIRQTYGESGQRWLDSLPELVKLKLADWNLHAGAPLASMTFNYVMRVTRADGTHAVLKLGPHLKGRAKEARALSLYGGNITARLLESDVANGALLLERIEPGTELKELTLAGRDAEATEIAAHLMRELLRQQHLTHAKDFTPVATWGLGFEKYLREHQGAGQIPISQIEKARAIFENAMKLTARETLLHGDLHHMNILRASRAPWLAIDPKGLWGDALFEIAAFMRNPMPELLDFNDLPSLLEERFRIFAEVLEADRDQLWAWSYSSCVLAAVWTASEAPAETENWMRLARVFEDLEHPLDL